MNIYVGNLSYDTRDNDLEQLFSQYGKVDQARVVIDKYTDRSRGFGFVEMANANEAQAAIEALNGHDLQGRTLRVNEARPRDERGGGGGGGRDRGGDRPRGGGGGGGGRGGSRY